MRRKVLIAGGGTAGHTNPGIAVAQSLVELGLEPSEILFVGSARGSEKDLVPAAGFEVKLLAGRGVARKISFTSLKSAMSLVRGIVQGIKLVFRTKPDVVLSLGGYAAMPAAIGAIVWRVPIVVTEQNARASSTNRFVSRFATEIAIPFPDTDLNGTVTGNPIRSSIEAPSKDDRASARAELGISENQALVAVWSGSLGARSVNKAVGGLAKLVGDSDEIFIYHVVGKRDFADYANSGSVSYKVIEYEDKMARLLNAADIAICRAGASTVAELAIVGLPSILVPLPGAPKDHQTANAKQFENVGACVVIKDSELNSEDLLSQLRLLLEDGQRLSEMADAARTIGRPDAARDVANLVINAGGVENG